MKQNFQKNKAVTGKTPFFEIDLFCTPHSVLMLASERVVLYGNVTFSILALSIKKRYCSFLKKFFVFQKTSFKA